MADSAIAVFGEPEAEVRVGREKWSDDKAAVEPLDLLIEAFSKAVAKQEDGFKRSVNEFSYKALPEPKPPELSKDASEDERKAAADQFTKDEVRRVSRIAERINERAAATETPVHARSIRGKLHMVKGTKPVIKRERKASAESNGDASTAESAETSPVTTGAAA